MEHWEDVDEELTEDVGFDEDQPGFIGPRVPPARYIQFRPRNLGVKIINDTSHDDRIASIFGHVLVDDATHRTWKKESPSDRYARIVGRTKFELDAASFLRRALSRQPTNPAPTASGFAQWIYSLYGSARGDEEDKERGLCLEAELIERRRSAASLANEGYLRSTRSPWKLVHNGLHDPSGDGIEYLLAPGLGVRGEPLRASPDLIYRHEGRSEVIVVEIKYSRMEIPGNLWPNIWGQLWCYSQLELTRTASKITVVGEVWGESWWRERKRGRLADVCMCASVRRDPRAPAYDRFFRTLFKIYSGSYSGH